MAHNRSLTTTFARKNNSARSKLFKKHPHLEGFLTDRKLTLALLRRHSGRLIGGAALSAALLMSTPKPNVFAQPGPEPVHSQPLISSEEMQKLLLGLPRKLFTQAQNEDAIITAVRQTYGVPVSFELSGNRIPVYLGSMGLEQHLYRYAGDDLSQHRFYQKEGIAPKLGAFRYFEREGVTKAQWEKEEEYYIVLQTFLIPTWNTNWQYLKDWYAFRKFLVINPATGKGVVAVLGDSGPAVWTGKVFGGSPEVMADLGFYPKYTRGDVVILFLDDPENKIPLGPIQLPKEESV